MSQVFWPRRRPPWAKPPSRPIDINYKYAPRGLIASYPLADPSHQELITGILPTISGVATFGQCPAGSGLLIPPGAGVGAAAFPVIWPSTSTPFSAELLLYSFATLSGSQFMGLQTGATSGTAIFQVNNTTNAPSAFWNNGASSTTSTVTPAAGTLTHVVVTGISGTQTLYVNGATSGTPGAIAFPFTSGGLPLFFTIGSIGGGGIVNLVFLMANLAKVAWSAAEVKARFLNPYGMYVYPEDLVSTTRGLVTTTKAISVSSGRSVKRNNTYRFVRSKFRIVSANVFTRTPMQFGKGLNVASAETVKLARSINHIIQVVQTELVNIVRGRFKTLTNVSASLIQLSKQFGFSKTFNMISSSLIQIGKQIGKITKITQGESIRIAHSIAKTISIISANRFKIIKGFTKSFNLVSGETLSLIKRIPKSFSFVSTNGFSTLKLIAKTLKVIIGEVVRTIRGAVSSKTFRIVITEVLNTQKAMAKTISLIQNESLGFTKFLGKTFILVQDQLFTLNNTITKFITLIQTQFVSQIHPRWKIFMLIQPNSMSMIKQVGMTITFVQGEMVSILWRYAQRAVTLSGMVLKLTIGRVLPWTQEGKKTTNWTQTPPVSSTWNQEEPVKNKWTEE